MADPTFDDLDLSNLHPDDRVFGMRPLVICLGCGCVMESMLNPLPASYILRHPKWDCAYSEYKFRFHAPPIVGTLLREE